jgi:thiamine-monophosphate kinase
VTGCLGDAAAGLELLRQGVREGSRTRSRGEARLLQRHLRPEPRVREAQRLAESGCASSMIDVSDGMSSDLIHICERSQVGAEVREAAIPRSRAFDAAEGRLAEHWPVYALSGGEDYELLFTVPPARAAKLRSLGLDVTVIGTVIKGRSLWIIGRDGKRTRCRPTGFDHFSTGRAHQRT